VTFSLKLFFYYYSDYQETAWAPILWAVNLLQKERLAGRIKMEAPPYATLIAGFDQIEMSNRKILDHGWVNFPLGIVP